MNIVLLGHRDIASNIALSLLVTSMPQHRYTVMLSGALAPPRAPALAELTAFEQRLCDELPGTRAAGDTGVLSFDALAEQTGRGIRDLTHPNSDGGVDQLSECRPDLIVSVRYRRILKDAAIAIPKFGVLNLHSGLLPEYKGVMATFWAMLNGEARIGSTVHGIVDGGIDTGPVVGRAEMAADRSRSYLSNVLSLYPSGCRLLVEAVERIERGEKLECTEQAKAGHYYSAPDAAAIDRFHQAGLRLFDGNELQAVGAAPGREWANV
jgi:methionyl-tRNA formyltransferase